MTRQEFGHLSTTLRGKLVAVARPFCRTAGLSEHPDDIAQEALVALWELSEKGYPIRDAEALAVRLTKNICVNHYRKRKLVFQQLKADVEVGTQPVTTRLDEEEIERIRQTLFKKLTQTQRELLTLRNDYGMSLDEIAAATGRPKNSIKVTISTARRQMLEELKKSR
jgi:RNA polymerase sigma-70 factor (ECF subfamily)